MKTRYKILIISIVSIPIFLFLAAPSFFGQPFEEYCEFHDAYYVMTDCSEISNAKWIYFNLFQRDSIPQLYNISDKALQFVLDSCACKDDPNRECNLIGHEWQNSTHYIDNDICEFVGKNEMIREDKIVLPPGDYVYQTWINELNEN